MRNEPTSVISRLSARLARRLYAWAERLQRSSTRIATPQESGQYTVQTLTSQLPTQGGPPAHWLEHVQPAGPPAHWLEYIAENRAEQAEATTNDQRPTTEKADIVEVEASVPSQPARADTPTRDETRKPSQQAQTRHEERKPASERPSVTPVHREEKRSGLHQHEAFPPRKPATLIAPAITRSASAIPRQIVSAEQARKSVSESKRPSSDPIVNSQSERRVINNAPIALNPKTSIAPKPLPEARTDHMWHNSTQSTASLTSAPEIPHYYPDRQRDNETAAKTTDIRKTNIERSDLQIPERPYRFVTLGDDASQRDMSPWTTQGTLIAGYWPSLPSDEWESAPQGANDAEMVKREVERLRRLENEQRGL